MTTDRILAPEELSDCLYPSELAISDDGRTIAFMVEPVGQKDEHRVASIWISRDAQPAKQFTSGLAADHSPAISPDSQTLAFLSDRHERKKDRVYRMALDGGEATQLGTVEGTLSTLRWSPAGTHLAILVEDPETDEDKKKSEERNDPIVADQNLKFNRLHVIDVESGQSRQLTFGERSVMSYAWNYAGTHLAVVTSSRTDVEGEFREVQLDRVPASGGLMQRLETLRSAPNALEPVASGSSDVWALRHNGFTFDPVDSIWLAGPGHGTASELLPDDHGNVDAISAVPGKKPLIGTRLVEGVHAKAVLVNAETGERCYYLPESWRCRGSLINGPVYSSEAASMAMIWCDGQTPEEVYVARKGDEPIRLTTFGTSFEGRLTPTETVEWESDGWTIQGILFYPANYEAGKRYPLLIEAHGGPSWQWEQRCFLNWHDWAQFMTARGYAVLAPNPRGSTGRGKDFQHALYGDVGGGEVRDLITGAQAMVDRGIADPDRLGIGGWSWGGYLTATTITRTTMFKAAMMGAGLSNLGSDHGTDDIPSANLLYFPGEPYHHADMYWEGSALKNITACTTPTLIIHGDADDRVTPAQGKEMYTALTRLGVPAEFVRYPRMGHNIKERNYQIDLLQRLERWFDTYLK